MHIFLYTVVKNVVCTVPCISSKKTHLIIMYRSRSIVLLFWGSTKSNTSNMLFPIIFTFLYYYYYSFPSSFLLYIKKLIKN
jgi:hypothetical protein